MRALGPLLLVCACGSSGTGTDGGSTSTDGGSAATDGGARSAGCDKPPVQPGTFTFTSDGRSTVVSLPANYSPTTAYPIVIAFHGGGDNGANFKSWSGVEPRTDDGAIFLYPDGPGGVWNDEVFDGDFGFVTAARAHVEAAYCVDTNALFAFGFSWGGWATTSFACNQASVVRGAVAIAGGGPQQSQCGGDVPIMFIHGASDSAEPLASSEESRTKFEALNGCSGAAQPFGTAGCTAKTCNAEVVWCEHAGGHEIPAFAPAQIWSFFDGLR